MSSAHVQSALLIMLDKAKAPIAEPNPKKVTPGNPRKRTLTLVNGSTVDLGQKIKTAAPDVVEAMRLRIIQLEDELASRSSAVAPPPAKRPRTSAKAADDDYVPMAAAATTATTASASGSGSAAQAKADKAFEKKTKARMKKIFDQLKKACKAADCKFQGRGPKTIKIDEILEPDEFDAIFRNKGELVQPTPTNKPTSTVTIIRYMESDIQALFGDELKPLKGDRWNVGGGRFFTKSRKLGTCDVEIVFIEVSYSKNTSKATLKFEVDQIGGGGSDSDDPDRFAEWFM